MRDGRIWVAVMVTLTLAACDGGERGGEASAREEVAKAPEEAAQEKAAGEEPKGATTKGATTKGAQPGGPMTGGAIAALDETYERIVEKRGGPVKTAFKGPIVDDEWNRNHFYYPSKLSEITGLDFVKLASVKIVNGSNGLHRIVEKTPDAGETAEAHRLMRLHDLAGARTQRKARPLLESLEDDSLDEAAQRAAWLDAYVKGWELRTDSSRPLAMEPASFPEAAKVAQRTGMEFDKLAFVQYKGGRRGLESLVKTFPELDDREEVLADVEK